MHLLIQATPGHRAASATLASFSMERLRATVLQIVHAQPMGWLSCVSMRRVLHRTEPMVRGSGQAMMDRKEPY